MDLKRLRNLANQNREKAHEEARRNRELESQRHLAELKKQEEMKDRERKRIEARKADIQRKVEEAASQGHYKLVLDRTEIVGFDWVKWYNPLASPTSIFSRHDGQHRQVIETYHLCQSLGLKTYFKMVEHGWWGTTKTAVIEMGVKW